MRVSRSRLSSTDTTVKLRGIVQPDEVRYEEDKKPLGLNFIKLGLDDVLYNPETGEIYTPNTNQSVQMNENRSITVKEPVFGEGHRIVDNVPDGNGGSDSSGGDSGLTDSSESGIVNVTIDNASKENITIDKRKLTEYALNPEKQPEKAEAFQKALGYNLSNYQELDNKIRDIFDKDKLIKTETTEFGTKYKQTMRITGPNQKTAKVLTAWIDSTSDSDNKDFHLTSVYVDK